MNCSCEVNFRDNSNRIDYYVVMRLKKKNVNFNWLITTRAMDLLRVNTFTILNFCRLFTFLSCNLKRERDGGGKEMNYGFTY